ncbi:hypothetical protein O3Q51_00595 [Cryomorphaceae bacterium 1068]|nr:hypothetical protein [Cryomorphaceae bacterium 1068]
MLRFLLKTLAFTGIVLITLRIIGTADNTHAAVSANQNIKRLQLAAQFDSLDILFVGNSYAYSSIIPASFDHEGFHTFNLGTASAGPFFYEIITHDYLETCSQKPKTIALTISPITFSILSDNFETYPIHRYLHKPIQNEAIAIEEGSPILYFQLLGKSAEKAAQNLRDGDATGSSKEVISPRGFYSSDELYNDSIYAFTHHFYLPLKEDFFDNNKAERLKSFIGSLNEKGIKVVLIEMPTNRLRDFISAEFMTDYAQFKKTLAAQYPIINFSGELTEHDYRNIDHMNVNGAKKFSQFLLTQEVLFTRIK